MGDIYNQENVYKLALERMKKILEEYTFIDDTKTINLTSIAEIMTVDAPTVLENVRENVISLYKKEKKEYSKWYKKVARSYLIDYFLLPDFCKIRITYPLISDVTPEISIEIPFENMVSLGWPTLHVWKSTYEKHHKLGFICDGIVFFCKDTDRKFKLSNIGDGDNRKHLPVYQKDDFLRRKDVWDEKETR